MSSYMVVAEASMALQQLLWDAFSGDPVIQPIVGTQQAIVLRNPTETARDSANRLSLWLYHITENEFAKNQPMTRPRTTPQGGNGQNSLMMPPLSLNLYYLLTPFAPSGDADHLLLGRAMQVMYDNSIVSLQNPGNQIAEELHISFCRLTLQELGQIWEALQEPYRLSVCYQVQITRIDSERLLGYSRITDQLTGYRSKAVPERE